MTAFLLAALAGLHGLSLSGVPLDRAVIGAPSMVVAVRHKDGHHEVKGYGALDDDRPPDGDSVYELGSITKTFTALLYARAVAEKRVTASTTLGALLAIPSSKPAAKIGLEQLATHTAGLPRLPPNLDVTKNPEDPYRDYTPALLLEGLAQSSLKDVGDVAYSNFGAGALGCAITQERGYAKALTDDVTAPLGLAHTRAFEPPEGARAATPHAGKTGKPTSPWHKTEALIGAGGMWSSANDLLSMSDALLAAWQRKEPSTSLEAALADVFRQRIPAVKPLVGDARPAIALAWHIRPDGVRWHNGGSGGTSTVWDVDPATGCAAIVLANLGDAGAKLDDVVNRALNACRQE